MARTTSVWSVLLLGLVLGWGAPLGRAQEPSPSPSAKTEEPARRRGPEAYRIDFSVDELEDGRKVNTRQYSMNLRDGQENALQIGTRVAVETEGKVQYLNVGTEIWCRLRLGSGDLVSLEVRGEISNFATPEQVGKPHPVIRHFRIGGSTLALPGKPVVIGSVDDPGSRRRFQMEVTATKLR